MKFQVPQFVEIEDKIFWRLTLKQFIFLAGGAGLSVIIYLFIKPFFLAIIVMSPILALSLALAFYRFNNRPFIIVVESAVKYILNNKLYIWKKEEKPVPITPNKKEDGPLNTANFLPKLSNSKLKELTWALDTKEAVNPGTRETGQK